MPSESGRDSCKRKRQDAAPVPLSRHVIHLMTNSIHEANRRAMGQAHAADTSRTYQTARKKLSQFCQTYPFDETCQDVSPEDLGTRIALFIGMQCCMIGIQAHSLQGVYLPGIATSLESTTILLILFLVTRTIMRTPTILNCRRRSHHTVHRRQSSSPWLLPTMINFDPGVHCLAPSLWQPYSVIPNMPMRRSSY